MNFIQEEHTDVNREEVLREIHEKLDRELDSGEPMKFIHEDYTPSVEAVIQDIHDSIFAQ